MSAYIPGRPSNKQNAQSVDKRKTQRNKCLLHSQLYAAITQNFIYHEIWQKLPLGNLTKRM